MSDQENTNAAAERQFAIQKIYVKDMSFESPATPQIFTQKWEPDVGLEINTTTRPINKEVFDVILTVTVTVKLADKTAYLAEAQQAGIFLLKGFSEQEMGHILGAACPNILFPFAREVVADLVNKGGFPQLLLSPVNFDALYAQHLERQRQGQAQETGAVH